MKFRFKSLILLSLLSYSCTFAGIKLFKTEKEQLNMDSFLQERLDLGDLQFKSSSFKWRKDIYTRRLDFIFKGYINPIDFKLELSLDRWFQNYLNGKSINYPNKLIVKIALLRWNFSKNFYFSIGKAKKPFSRVGLVSSKNLLLIDKPELFFKLKHFLGNYYSAQFLVGGNFLQNSLKWQVATAYSYEFHNYNKLKVKTIHMGRYLFNNIFIRFTFSPQKWLEEKSNNTTFGKRALSIGVSYGYLGDFYIYRNGICSKGVGILEDVDFFIRKPNFVKGSLVLSYEYQKGKYILAKLANRGVEGFYTEIGYRPYFLNFKGLPLEFAFRFEDISFHPGRVREYIYNEGLNIYSLNKKLKFTYNLQIINHIREYDNRVQKINSFQLQYFF